MLERFADILGVIGVVMVLLAYFLLNTNKLTARHVSYQVSNFVGSSFILFSLLFTWNLPSVIIEFAWILISLLGLYRALFVRE